MGGFFNRRRTIGGVIGLLAISGVALAVILGSARINENTARSGEIPPPLPADVVAIALIDATVDFCEGTDVQYEVIASSKLFTDRLLDFQGESEFLGQSDFQVCVRNDFSAPVQIDATIEAVVSDELSGCPDQYEAGAGDTTCDPGQGELGNGELSVGFAPLTLGIDGFTNPGPNGSCITDVVQASLVEAGTVTVGQLDPGGFCSYNVVLIKDVTADYTASSTDTVQFDIVFYADDGT